MKRAIGMLVMAGWLASPHGVASAQEQELAGGLTLSGAWAIYPTAVAWAEAFQKLHPKVTIDVSAGGGGKGAADAIAGLVDLGMVSRDPDPAELKKGIMAIYILHDAVFPVISDKNPALQELLARGVTKDALVGLYVTGVITTWDDVAGHKIGKPVHVYTRSDSCGAAASWAKYLGHNTQEDLRGIGVYGDPGLLEAVTRDPAGIGYANFSYVFTREGPVVPGARLVPIDSNANGLADPDEVYENRQAAIQAIESGRYPATRKNYFFVKGAPQGLVKVFLAFALSEEGTRIVGEVGTSLPLPKGEREQALRGLQ